MILTMLNDKKVVFVFEYPSFKNTTIRSAKRFFILPVLFLFLSFVSQISFSQDKRDSIANDDDLLSVFLDFSVHQQYIREKITFVNYVRDRELSKVHIMIRQLPAGMAGENYVISFFGRGAFEGMNNEITYWDPGTSTTNETRQGLVEMITMGLAPYLANTDIVSHMSLVISAGRSQDSKGVEDPWKNWVFEVYGGINFARESKQSRFDSRWGFYADKVSEDWKIRSRPYFNINRRTFLTDEEEITRQSYRHGFDGYYIKSISQHWSAGLFVDMLSSTFHNILFNIEAAPGIEYSLFPYREATYKAITFVYRLGGGYHNYIEETVFFKDQESLFNHTVDLSARFQQPWGSFSASISGSHYFHDFTANRLSFESDLGLRIIKGLSVNISGSFNFINDLVALPAGDLSLEDILLQQSRQATNYEANGRIGITYTFGSQFSNVINTRF